MTYDCKTCNISFNTKDELRDHLESYLIPGNVVDKIEEKLKENYKLLNGLWIQHDQSKRKY